MSATVRARHGTRSDHRRTGRARVLSTLAAFALVLAACTEGVGVANADADPTWRTSALVDVRTGEPFSIDGLQGRLVAIEPMAIWCTTCRIQQQEAATALAAIASDDLVYVGLDVDPNEPADALAEYADVQGFDWPFAVASPQVSRSLAATFGDQVLSPPSTPLILVGPDGELIDVHFGIRDSNALEAFLRQHLP